MIWLLAACASPPGDTYSARLVGEASTSSGFLRAEAGYPWDFPADFGPHPDFQTEWWYYTGNLETANGHRFGYQLTFFRRGLLPPAEAQDRDSLWAGDQVYMGHFALSDIGSSQHYAFERFARGAVDLAGAQAEPFQVWLENWQIIQISENEWRMRARQEAISIDLFLRDDKGITFHGIDGYSQKGSESGNASYYFSQTRLVTDGEVTISSQTFLVSGLSWMDHEFSTSALSAGQIGWDWFSLQMDQGADLMVFQIRREDGTIDPFSSGTLVLNDGEVFRLGMDEFDIQIRDSWRSSHSDTIYPSAWTISVPRLDLRIDVEPLMADQEMILSYIYWEGAVGLSGDFQGQPVKGSGYVELTGYADTFEEDF
jgi:predicted secreted hydrolase